MPDQYVTITQFKKVVGGDVSDAVASFTNVDVDDALQRSTASVQGAMRNSGYDVGTTTDEVQVENAVIGLTWEWMANVPEANLKLPDSFYGGQFWLAWVKLEDGTAQLAADPTPANAVGGSKFSATDASLDSNARAQRTSRSQLRNY